MGAANVRRFYTRHETDTMAIGRNNRPNDGQIIAVVSNYPITGNWYFFHAYEYQCSLHYLRHADYGFIMNLFIYLCLFSFSRIKQTIYTDLYDV